MFVCYTFRRLTNSRILWPKACLYSYLLILGPVFASGILPLRLRAGIRDMYSWLALYSKSTWLALYSKSIWLLLVHHAVSAIYMKGHPPQWVCGVSPLAISLQNLRPFPWCCIKHLALAPRPWPALFQTLTPECSLHLHNYDLVSVRVSSLIRKPIRSKALVTNMTNYQ